MHNLKTIATEFIKVMRIHKLVFILTLTLAVSTLLTACGGSSSTYNRNNQWDYGSTTSKSAQKPPRPISEESADAVLSNEQSPQRPAPVSQNKATKANLPAVKVALLAPLSGQHAKLGQSMLNASQLALFDMGHSNYQIIPKDTRATASGAKAAAQEAISDGAELIIGPVFAESVRAVKPIASASQINMLAFSTDWSLAGGNTFIMGFLPFDQVERLTNYVAAKNIKRIGVIAPNDNYGRVVTKAYNDVAPQYGIQTTASKSFNPRSRNLGPDVREFAGYDSNPQNAATPFDAVLMPVGGQTAITIANLLAQYDLPPRTVIPG